ncbi:hypothetical protein AVBRAN12642_02280 [Campylobacter sp. RM12642]|uniref:hypothetical protein n=1 Tax=unclassified Campylobacter TaxID=2593542 RepID=UPI001DB8E464|nr:hypothetical protein [Campylobacter sp. RM12642]MBZ8006658.1 hypothetical protein [Campylobacter sp. RM9334]
MQENTTNKTGNFARAFDLMIENNDYNFSEENINKYINLIEQSKPIVNFSNKEKIILVISTILCFTPLGFIVLPIILIYLYKKFKK